MTESDVNSRLDSSFTPDQESLRKDIERVFGVLKKKFLVVTHLINLQHPDDIYYSVLASIMMRNMLVKVHVEDGEKEDASMCNVLEMAGHDEIAAERDLQLEVYFTAADDNLVNHKFDYKIAQKKWQELYDYNSVIRLKTAMELHLYWQKFGSFCENYNPVDY